MLGTPKLWLLVTLALVALRETLTAWVCAAEACKLGRSYSVQSSLTANWFPMLTHAAEFAAVMAAALLLWEGFSRAIAWRKKKASAAGG